MDLAVVDVAEDERRQRGEVPARCVASVDSGDDACERSVGFAVGGRERSVEIVDNLSRCHAALENGVEQTLAEGCAAALVAENEAERRDVVGDRGAVVEAGVAARAEYAGYARVVAEHSSGRAEHIGADLDHVGTESVTERVGDAAARQGAAAAGAVIMQLRHRAVGIERGSRTRECVAQTGVVAMRGVYPRRDDRSRGLTVGTDCDPADVGRAGIYYELVLCQCIVVSISVL